MSKKSRTRKRWCTSSTVSLWTSMAGLLLRSLWSCFSLPSVFSVTASLHALNHAPRMIPFPQYCNIYRCIRLRYFEIQRDSRTCTHRLLYRSRGVGEEIVVLSTKYGDMKIQLFPEYAPLAFANFKELVSQNAFDGHTVYSTVEGAFVSFGIIASYLAEVTSNNVSEIIQQ